MRERIELSGKILESIKRIESIQEGAMNRGERDRINRELYKIGQRYHRNVPLDVIFKILKDRGVVVLQEDLTEWSGMLSGRSGRETFEVADELIVDDGGSYVPFNNTMLVLSWYRLESGKYEVLAHLS